MTDQTRPKGLTAGSFAATTATGPDRRQRRQAAAFVADQGYEELLELRRTDPRAFARLGASIRTATAYYNSAKTAFAKESGHDNDD